MIFGPSHRIDDLIESAFRLASDRAILRLEGKVDGQRLVVAAAVGPGADRLAKLIADNGVLDPRSTWDEA